MSEFKKEKLGLIHVYCGEGKGKTTAAMGLALRGIGNDFQVIVGQFLKNGSSGELEILKDLSNVTVITNKNLNKFSFNMNEDEKESCRQNHIEIFKKCVNSLENTKSTLIIFDEILGAMDKNLIDKDIIINFLKSSKDNCEVILTGRNPSAEVLEIADYVTEMKKVKHPFDRGLNARYGIEK